MFNYLITHHHREGFILEGEGILQVVVSYIKIGLSLLYSLYCILRAFQTDTGDAKLVTTFNKKTKATAYIQHGTGFAFPDTAGKQFSGGVPAFT
jgi:hypothetical protein